jgi:hypothetical protein
MGSHSPPCTYSSLCVRLGLACLARREQDLWGAFCSERPATTLVNGHTSQQQSLPQAGLPQGLPLSPMLVVFFNADLLQHRLNVNGGSIAFVDDCNPWVTGPSAEANRDGIQAIIDRDSIQASLIGQSSDLHSQSYYIGHDGTANTSSNRPSFNLCKITTSQRSICTARDVVRTS